MNDYAKKLGVLRRMQNRPQKSIASDIGVKQETVSKWERGITIIPDQRVNAIAESLNCEPGDFRTLSVMELISKIMG